MWAVACDGGDPPPAILRLLISYRRSTHDGEEASMTIDGYLRKHAMSTSALARKLRCSKATISVWRSGYHRPSPALMKRIAQVTRGEVSAADFPPARSRLAVRLARAARADATRADQSR